MHLAGEPVKPLPFQGHEDLTKNGGYNGSRLTSGVNGDEEVVSFVPLEQVLDQPILGDKAGEYDRTGLNSTDCKQNGHKLDPAPLYAPETAVLGQKTEFYMNRAVTDVEQPKMILCYKEGSYDIIKDICVDEGLPENEVKHVKSSADFNGGFCASDRPKLASLEEQLHPDLSGEDTDRTSSGDLPEEREDMSGTADSSDGLQSTQDERHGSDAGGEDPKRRQPGEIVSVDPVEPVSRQSPRRSGRRCSLADLLAEDRKDSGPYGGPLYSSVIQRSPEPEELVPQQEPDKEQSHADMPSSESNLDQTELIAGQPQAFDSDPLQPPDQDSAKPPPPVGDSTTPLSSTYDRSSTDQAIEGTPEEPESSTSITASEEIKEEKESDSGVKTDAFDAAISEKESLGGISEIQPSGFSTSGAQDANVNAPVVASRPSFYRGNGDSSLLGPSFLSGRIMYSGHLQYSGSISLRSDSSTTSTRSFAFPILQSEWNSSPIKMARAERGRFRRRRGWGSGLFCCRA